MEQAILTSPSPPETDATASVVAQCSASEGVLTTRVLHVINGQHYSGAERVQDLLAELLPEMGFEVVFAAIKPAEFATARRSQQARLVELPMNFRFDLRVVRKLVKLVREEGVELIHAHTPRTAMVARLAAQRTNVPFVYHVHSPVTSDSTRRLQNWLNGQVESWAVDGTAQLVCVSPSLETYMRNRGVPQERITCVPNGVPVHRNAIDRTTPTRPWTLGAVALFRPRKGLEVLLEALSTLVSRGVDVRLRAIGAFESPGYESTIMCCAERLQLGDRIDWRGFSTNVATELDDIDLMVLPSLFGEGLPMVVLEAMAAGVPVVASRVEGVPEAIVHRETGLLVEPGSVSQLVHAIEEFVARRVDYTDMSRRSRARHGERFSDVAMAADVAAVYRHVLELPTGIGR